MSETNIACRGYRDGMKRDECCDAHSGYASCDARDGSGRVVYTARKGHLGPHAGYGFSTRKPEVW